MILLLILFAGLGAWVFSALLSGNNPSTPSTDASPEKTSIQKLQEQDFEKWIANFEAAAPVFVAGQQARLELNSGQILSGEIQAIKNDFVLIMTDQGTKEIPYSTLKPLSLIHI